MDIPSYSEENQDQDLPQCKIKRNYSCSICLYYTQNPRFYLTHLRDVHGERIIISNCSLCLYASRHYQKLVRHMKMVHGSTSEGIPEQQRKRPLIEEIVSDYPAIAPLPTSSKWIIDIDKLSYDLKSSRKTLKDIAAIYFAENDIEDILAKMEASDVVEVEPVNDVLPSMGLPARSIFGDPKYIGDEDLDIACPCGRVSKGFLDLAAHGKSCSRLNENKYESAPLDLSIRSSFNLDSSLSNSMDGMKIDRQLIDKLDSKTYQYNNVSKIAHEDLDKDSLGISKHSKNLEIHSDQENKESVVITPIIPKEEAITPASHRKVFKCPLCPFWASTASRFHVHIVGHQNKKPFKCSLCAYSSNWRWDITKHIRLRTLRSSSHKNARVLMQGENNRRNYTKYDRFITLMKISNYDADFKLKKCGEIKLNDGGSEVISSEPNTEDLKKEIENDENTKPIYSPGKIQTPMEAVPNNTFVRTRSKESNPRTYLILEDGDKPVYKCSMCQFRHSNRDAVLVHVKIHHQDLLKSSLILSKSSKTTSEIQQTIACEEVKPNEPSKNNADLMIVDVENDHNATVSTCKTDCSIVTNSPLSSPNKDYLEDENNVADIVVSENRASNSYNDNVAPFRCWHCHQVSNWKHVIQRHCRLKHSGSIRIEAIDRSIDANNPIYRMLNLSSNFDVLLPNGIQADCKSENLSCNEKETKHQNSSIELQKESSNKINVITFKNSSKSRLNLKNAKQNRSNFKCKECPYVCTKKLQLNKHYIQKHKQSNTLHKKIQKSCAEEKSHNSTSNDISDKQEKCHNSSRCVASGMKCHEESHSQICKSSSSNFKQNEVFAATTDHHPSPRPMTLNKADNFIKVEKPLLSENTSLKKISEINLQMDKIDKKIQLKTKINNYSAASINKKTSNVNPPAKYSHKTILVNPKTGQIVRRN